MATTKKMTNDWFGYALGVSAARELVIGVPNRNIVHVFALNSSNLFEEKQTLGDSVSTAAQFGCAISVHPSGFVAIGAYTEEKQDLGLVGNAYAYACLSQPFNPMFLIAAVTAGLVTGALILCCLIVVIVLVLITVFNVYVFLTSKSANNTSSVSSNKDSNNQSQNNSNAGIPTEEALEMPSVGSLTLSGVESQAITTSSSAGLLDSTRSRSGSAPRIIIDSQTFEISFEEIEIINKIDSGAFGAVYRAKWNQDMCAVKKFGFNFDTDAEMEVFVQEFEKEISLLGQLRHAHILGFLGACTKPPDFAIVTELMENGSLYDAIHKKKLRIKWPKCVSIASNISSGMNFLHRKGIIHRDLKSKNILLDSNFVGKVCDFGLAKSTGQMEAKINSKMTQSVGTPLWMAPEVAMNDNYDNSCDVFSFGIILWELLTHKVPYDGIQINNPSMIYLKVASTEEFRPTIPDVTKDGSNIREMETKLMYIELMKRCWKGDPKQRPPFVEILAELDVIKAKLKNASNSISLDTSAVSPKHTEPLMDKGTSTPDKGIRPVFPTKALEG